MSTCSVLGRRLRSSLLAVLAFGLSGCLPRPGPVPTRAGPAPAAPAVRSGRAYRVVPNHSRLIILVYRAGPLAAFGHNHVIACRCVSGTFHVPGDVLATSFTLRIPVARLTVDDPRLRAAQHSAAFAPEVSAAARQGTRHNMLSAAVLDARAYPLITIRAERLRRAPANQGNAVLARVRIELRGRMHSITVPVHYTLTRGRLVARGEFSLEQSSLGLTPFSVLFGALRVKNRLTLRFHLVAVPTATAHVSGRRSRLPSRPRARRPVAGMRFT